MSEEEEEERRRRNQIIRSAASSDRLNCEEAEFLALQANLIEDGHLQGPQERWRTGYLVARVVCG